MITTAISRDGAAWSARIFCAVAGFADGKALHQIKIHLPHGEKIGSRFDALSDSVGAKSIGEVEDLAAHHLPQPVVGAVGDKLSIDLFDLDEGKVMKFERQRPFRSKIVDRDSDVAEPKLSGDMLRQVQVAKRHPQRRQSQ